MEVSFQRLMGVQPRQHAWVEIVGILEMKGVAGIVVEVGVAVRNATGYLIGHPHRGENVVLAADNQAGLGDVGELVDDIVAGAGGGLSDETV